MLSMRSQEEEKFWKTNPFPQRAYHHVGHSRLMHTEQTFKPSHNYLWSRVWAWLMWQEAVQSWGGQCRKRKWSPFGRLEQGKPWSAFYISWAKMCRSVFKTHYSEDSGGPRSERDRLDSRQSPRRVQSAMLWWKNDHSGLPCKAYCSHFIRQHQVGPLWAFLKIK